MESVFMTILWLAHALILFDISSVDCATVRSFPNYDYGGKEHAEFIHEVLNRQNPQANRLLSELLGGLDLHLELTDKQAIITVGGPTTKCQHQSPCYDSNCKACYDPLLRIHGKCGGASYFTCRGSLPKPCLPHTCTYKGPTARSMLEMTDETIFVKKFPRFEDTYCLGIDEKARSLNFNDLSRSNNDSERGVQPVQDHDPEWVMPVQDAVTPCKGYDTCIDMKCNKCYDPYLGTHTTCGKLTYYNCTLSLPNECAPIKCTEMNVDTIFPLVPYGPESPRSNIEDFNAMPKKKVHQLMVRDFPPLQETRRNCL